MSFSQNKKNPTSKINPDFGGYWGIGGDWGIYGGVLGGKLIN